MTNIQNTVIYTVFIFYVSAEKYGSLLEENLIMPSEYYNLKRYMGQCLYLVSGKKYRT